MMIMARKKFEKRKLFRPRPNSGETGRRTFSRPRPGWEDSGLFATFCSTKPYRRLYSVLVNYYVCDSVRYVIALVRLFWNTPLFIFDSVFC